MNRKPIRLAALVAILALALASVASGSPNRKIWCVANLCVADDGGISPVKLPRDGKAPVTALLSGEVLRRWAAASPIRLGAWSRRHSATTRTASLLGDKRKRQDEQGDSSKRLYPTHQSPRFEGR